MLIVRMKQNVSVSRKRNRSKPAMSLEDRLLKFAEEARAGALRATSLREKDELNQKAQQAEAMANAATQLRE